MRHAETYLAGIGTALGTLVDANSAVRDGLFAPEDAAQMGQRSASVATEPALDLGRTAARRALDAAAERAGCTAAALLDEISCHLHASVCSPGLEVWSPSCSLLDALGKAAGPGLSAGLGAVSNGGTAALELAATWRAAAPDCRFALVTTADRYVDPYFPRWSTERGMVFGDGASAVVVGPEGPCRILATASYTDPTMERLHRGHDPVRGGGEPHITPVDLRARSRTYVAELGGPEEVTRRHTAALNTLLGRLQKDTGLDLDDYSRIVLPFFGRAFIENEYLRLFDIAEDRTLLDHGLRIGHLGAGDQFVGLAHLLDTGLVRSGDHVLLLGIGAGFTWTTVAVDIC